MMIRVSFFATENYQNSFLFSVELSTNLKIDMEKKKKKKISAKYRSNQTNYCLFFRIITKPHFYVA